VRFMKQTVRGFHPVISAGIVLLAIALCLGPSLSCAKKDPPADAGKLRSAKPVLVTAATAVKKPIPVELKTFGSVEARSTVSVKAEVSGRITKIHFQKGQQIHMGDMLFTIDPRPFQAALDQAQANLTRVEVQRTEAQKNAARDAELLKKGITSPSDSDRSQAAADALDAEARADQAAIDAAKLQLEHCFIKCPIEGRAGNLLIHEGNLIKAGDDNLVTIKQIRPIEAFFSIPQKDLPMVKTFMERGTLRVEALPPEEQAPEHGDLFFVDNAVDKTTGTILLGAVFPNEAERLWPGQYVHITLTLAEQSDATVVPSKAIQTGRDGKYVFVIRDDQSVEIRPVTVGTLSGDDVMVEKGLQAGDQVVTDGQFRLTAGSRIEIQKQDSTHTDNPNSNKAQQADKGVGQ
jgi:membrane fusion protein, multidrug efflux system